MCVEDLFISVNKSYSLFQFQLLPFCRGESELSSLLSSIPFFFPSFLLPFLSALVSMDWDLPEFEPNIGSGSSPSMDVDLNLGTCLGGDFRSSSIWKPQQPQQQQQSSSSGAGQPKRHRQPTNGSHNVACLVDGCKSDLSNCRDYHRRHKVCETHSKTPVVLIGGQEQRFCQQCSRFHLLIEFDEIKRSCRKRLDGHNRRRRKPQPDPFSGNLHINPQASGFTLYSSHNIFSTTTVAAEAVGERGLQSYYGCQPLLNTISFTGNSSRNRNDKMILDGLTEALDCDCALSLLSPPPPQHQQPSPSTQTLNLSHQHHSHSHMILPHSGTDHTFPQQYGSGFNRYSSRSQSSPDASTTGEFSCSGIIDDPRSNVLDLQSSSIFGGSTSPHGDGGHSILLPYSWP
ncbi:hypothetical protein ZOSMA_2G01340 [Zostera marina]|uniref:SBP-type domain-containing protein n=1 Tax=Zostera marina TaxID=29655 RepID=A0A0K9PD24_ZOSMR|nr:hypothetical protein ZOSMA_2G01340 [Zostera marina]